MSIQVVAFNLEHYSNCQDAKLSNALEVLNTPDFSFNPKGALLCASNYLAAARRFSSADIAIALVLPNKEDRNHPLFIPIDVAGELIQSIISPDRLKQQELTEDVIATIAMGIAAPKTVDFVYFDSNKYASIYPAFDAGALHTFDLIATESSYYRWEGIQCAILQASRFNNVTPTIGAYDVDSKTFISIDDLNRAVHHLEWWDIKQGYIIARRLKLMKKL